ncbi:hypothetical protein DERP_013122 [Dermatophagoides pteronyssinus]|uniref:Uncharacterized protein n=1 Tax=Dermatophagoides pteronyssinus TaxID=6956 RepID=A0ABQ8J5L6_DERPT|nr:hypothetical protein DERP_013122 [Dermatophagoides pteronyssinus]
MINAELTEPPSTNKQTPLIKLAASLAKYATALAQSNGSPIRPTGYERAAISAIRSVLRSLFCTLLNIGFCAATLDTLTILPCVLAKNGIANLESYDLRISFDRFFSHQNLRCNVFVADEKQNK